MNALAAALIAELDDEALDMLATRLEPILVARSNRVEQSSWLHVNAAAQHLACPTSRIYSLVSAKRIPHHRDGTRLLFDRKELDTWLRAGGAKRP
jgi:excisionase family DNA binding protein